MGSLVVFQDLSLVGGWVEESPQRRPAASERARARAIALWINNSTPTDVNGVRCIWSPIRGPLTRFLTFRFVDDWRKCLFVHQMLWNFVIRRRKNQLEKRWNADKRDDDESESCFFFRAIGPRVPIDSPTNKNRKMIYVVPPIAKQRSATEIIYIHTHLLWAYCVSPHFFFLLLQVDSPFGIWLCNWMMMSLETFFYFTCQFTQ